MQCGPIRYEIRQNETESHQVLRHALICRDTSFTLPEGQNNIPIQDIYTALMTEEMRNKLILDDVIESLEEGRSPILLTERREHLEYFANHLSNVTKNVIVLRGAWGSNSVEPSLSN